MSPNGVCPVSLSQALSTATTVSYYVGGSANSGTDYVALNGAVVIPAGATSIAVAVTPLNSTFVGTRTVVASLYSNANYAIATPSTATVTIASGGLLASISASQPNAQEGAPPQTGQFTVTLSQSFSSALTVNYTVDYNSSAQLGTDFVALSGTVVVNAGKEYKEVATNEIKAPATEGRPYNGSTPTFSGDLMFTRVEETLYCVGK